MGSNATYKVVKPFDKRDFKPTAQVCGEVLEKEYRLVRDTHANCEYIEVGERDIKGYVESFKNGCSLKAILDRCAFLPTHEKVRYLNQTMDGMSADLSSMPKDGTEAQIMIASVKRKFPDFCERLKNGESFESLITLALSGSKEESDKKTVKEGDENG